MKEEKIRVYKGNVRAKTDYETLTIECITLKDLSSV